jgi:chaperonin GroES
MVMLAPEQIDPKEISPLEDQVLIKLLTRDKTEGGIWLPKNTGTPCRVGKVVAVGPGIPNKHSGQPFPMNLKPHTYVLFMDYGGEKVQHISQEYRLLREQYLWADVELSATDDLMNFEVIHPRADRLVVELKDETYTQSGLVVLPNKDMPIRWRIGTVKFAGYGIWHLESGRLLPMEVGYGDKVIFRRYTGADIWVRGNPYRIIQEVDVMAVLDKDENIVRSVHGNVIVERETEEIKSSIVIPERAKEKLKRGKVVASSAGIPYTTGEARRPVVKPGQTAFFKMGIEDIRWQGKDLTVCDHKEMMAVAE